MGLLKFLTFETFCQEKSNATANCNQKEKHDSNKKDYQLKQHN